MTKKTTAKKSTATKTTVKTKATSNDSAEKLLAIRDLLFGEQVSQLESTINSHNKSITTRIDKLEKLITKTQQQFKDNINKAVEKINDTIDSHHSEHESQESILEDKLMALGKSLEQYQNQTEGDFNEAQNELSNAAKEIYNSLESEVKQLSDRIDKTSRELSSNKADRKTLASLLEGMASNLNKSQA